MKERTKVFSVRFDERTMKLLDEFLSKHRYWKRNSVIERMVVTMLEGADWNSIQTMLNHYKFDDKKLKVTVTEVPKDAEASSM